MLSQHKCFGYSYKAAFINPISLSRLKRRRA